MMIGKFSIAFVLAVLLSGCSGAATSLTTGSLFGGGEAEESKPQPAAAPEGDATSRAFQVGSVSARAVKCGYNFDPAALKSKFLATESTRGATPEMIARAEKIYDVAYNGVWKGVATQDNYCSASRTEKIRADLKRHLAGDYSPGKRKVVTSETNNGSGSWFSSQ